MTLEKLEELACKFFNINVVDLRSRTRVIEYTRAKHIFRTVANVDYRIPRKEIVALHGIKQETVLNSTRVILEKGQFAIDYAGFKNFVKTHDFDSTETVVDKSGIERVTNEAFDERFYKHPTRINERTGLPFFPAFHFITSMGSPEPIGLTKWRQDKGHFADYILERSSEIGSYVHDCIDNMLRLDILVEHSEIHSRFSNHKEAQRVKECLLGFLNFMEAEEPVILASEHMMCGKDFGFTMDLKCRLKSDEYKNTWTVDWKTSKVANDDHKMQIEVMRRVSACDKGMVVILGNSTKKKYTATVIKPSEQDHWWFKFNAVKETAYLELLKRGTIKPRENTMPQVFSVRKINFKRKFQ